MLDQIRQVLRDYLNLSIEIQSKLFSSLVVLLFLWGLRYLAARFIHGPYQGQPRLQYNWRKAIQYISIFLGILIVGRIWLEGIQSLATYLGLVTAGIAIALQDGIVNLAGWTYILWQRPFKVGDRIEIGDVIDIALMEFILWKSAINSAPSKASDNWCTCPTVPSFTRL